MSDMESKARMSTSSLCSHFKLSTFSSFPALLRLSYNSFLDRDAGSENVPPSLRPQYHIANWAMLKFVCARYIPCRIISNSGIRPEINTSTRLGRKIFLPSLARCG